ncbi:hypothetical protein LCGC14_2381850 [marine sediment metagenome]|uniref:Uncharacterized protein n=1 Tax=marine sediment metagenome TaxID=412755 RepID=A0A0F9EVH0_9ZZZZ
MTSYDHFVMFHAPASSAHNIIINIEKSYPDLSVWKGNVFPPHPPEVHDFIWHRALANMITLHEKQRREVRDSERPTMMGKIEILSAQTWLRKRAEDELAIKALSKQMLGEQPSTKGLSA